MAEPAHKLPEEDQPDIRPHFGAFDGGGQGSEPSSSENLHNAEEGFYNPGGDESSAKATNSEGLREAEGDTSTSGSNSDEGTGGGLYNPNDKGRFSRIRGKVSGLSSKKKWAIAGVGGGGGAIGLIVILLLIFASSLEIPNLAQNILTYEFARVTRQFAQSADRTTEEALADESADDSTYAQLKEKFANVGSAVRDNTWGKLDQFRPSKVINTLSEGDEGLTFHFTTSKLTGRQILQYGEIGGERVAMEQVGGIAKWVPLLRQIKTVQNQANFVSKMAPLIEDQMDASDVRSLVRIGVANQLRKEANISLTGLILGKFKDDSDDPEKASLEAAREQDQAVNEGATVPDNSVTEPIKEATEAAETAEQDTLSSDTDLEAAISNGGVAPKVLAAIQSAGSSSVFDTAVGIINPLYGIAMPLCIIYDGSVQQSGPSIEDQTNQQQAAFYYVESVGDEQKYGSHGSDPQSDTELATAIHAETDNVGDITQSNPYIRASGGTVDTSSSVSAEAGSGGGYNYSLINAIGVSGLAATITNEIIGQICPILTSPGAAGALGALNLAAAAASFGASDAAEEAAGQGAGAFIKAFAEHLVESVIGKKTVTEGTKEVERSLVSRVGQFLIKQGKSAAAVAGITVLAHLVVAARAGQIDSGLAQGTDLANEADAGGNIQAGEIERAQLFGRPMLPDEVCASNQDDQAFVVASASKESAFQRYLAPSNANSLLSRTAIAVQGTLNGSVASSVVRLSSDLLRPFELFGSLADMLFGQTFAAANCNSVNTDYGNVQFGWSDQEENIIDGDDSYLQLQNQQALDGATNGGEAAIAQQYAVCFGYKYDSSGDGSLDPSDTNSDLKLADGPGDPGSLGELLANGDIQRDSSGNVTDSGLCSPSNLGYNDNAYGPHMVFRWRLAMQYDLTLNQLSDEQGVQADAGSSTTNTSGPANNVVYVVGDSLTVGAEQEGNLQQQMQTAGWNVNQIEATVGDTVEDAIPKVQADSQNVKAAGTVIVALGTNDYTESQAAFSQQITNMINTIKGINPSAKIYWVNTYSTKLDMTSVNAAIAAEASSEGYTIMDWSNEVTTNPGKYNFDPSLGVHLDGPGYQARSAFMVKSLGTPPSGVTSGG